MAWELWRQDELGNEFLVRVFEDRGGAERARDDYAARGHHQHYWLIAQLTRSTRNGGEDSSSADD